MQSSEYRSSQDGREEEGSRALLADSEYRSSQDGMEEEWKQGLACRVVITEVPRMAGRNKRSRDLLAE